MGYACPVCGAPQADGEHLANHLAITGLLHGAEHAAWLDEHVGEWTDESPATLAGSVTEFAEEIDAEPTTEGTAPTFEDDLARRTGAGRTPSEDVAEVLEDARELTAEMLEEREE